MDIGDLVWWEKSSPNLDMLVETDGLQIRKATCGDICT